MDQDIKEYFEALRMSEDEVNALTPETTNKLKTLYCVFVAFLTIPLVVQKTAVEMFFKTLLDTLGVPESDPRYEKAIDKGAKALLQEAESLGKSFLEEEGNA